MKDKHLRLTLKDDGFDIFAPRQGQRWGYRYGPSILQYGDGRMDAWFASPGAAGEADWFTWRHSDDDGKTWSDEVVVLAPTPDSMDVFSVCDPAVILIDGWYYIGYTSTIFTDGGGICNNGFLARARRPEGPYYKWTGTGWGEQRIVTNAAGDTEVLHWMGRPAPVVYYDEPWAHWGAGEWSFVQLDSTLYMYYTWTSRDADGQPFSQTRVATADLTAGDAWPATIRHRGVALQRPATNCDSSDAIYVDEAEKFLILCTDRRFTDESRLAVYESCDGLRFTRACEVRTHVGEKCHNCGISGGPDRHVSLYDEVAVAYAYGAQWGFWGTRFHKAVLSLTDAPDFSDADAPAAPFPVAPLPPPAKPWPIHITTLPHFYECNVDDGPFAIDLRWVDTCYNLTPCPADAVTYTGYDAAIAAFDGLTCTPRGVGYTYVRAAYGGRSVEFLVRVRPAGAPRRADTPWQGGVLHGENQPVLRFDAMQPLYTLHLADNECKQVRGLAQYADGSWFEIGDAKDGVRYTGYDPKLITVSENGEVRAVGPTGCTGLTAVCRGRSFSVIIEIAP